MAIIIKEIIVRTTVEPSAASAPELQIPREWLEQLREELKREIERKISPLQERKER